MLENVTSFVADLVSNPIFVVLTSVFSVFGTLFTLWSHFYSHQRKKISFDRTGMKVITQGRSYLEDIEITHKGNHIDTLTVTKYVIWNSGNKMIEASDMVPSEPLRIFTNDDSKILSAKVTDVVNPSNMFAITENPDFDNAAVISFDYLSPNEGAVIQILHTGSSSLSLSFDYQIKGGKAQTKRKGIASYTWFIKLNHFFTVNMDIISLSALITFYFYIGVSLLLADPCPMGWRFLIGIILALLAFLFVGYIRSRNSMQVPKKLRMYTDYNK